MMIKSNDTEITEEQFNDIAERDGYVGWFGYPIYMQAVDSDLVVRFASLNRGTIVNSTEGSRPVGYTSSSFISHTNKRVWKPWQPHKELKKQYEEDAKTSDKPWELWEIRVTGQNSWYTCHNAPCWNLLAEYRRKEVKPKTYDGYTLDQLNKARDEELLFEFWDSAYTSRAFISILSEVLTYDATYAFKPANSICFTQHCRLHHSQPQFVIDGKKPDWLDGDARIVINGSSTVCLAKNVRFDNPNCKVERFQVVGL